LYLIPALITVFFTLVETQPILLATGIPEQWQANEYQPPVGIGAPRRIEPGGTRNPGSCEVPGKSLTALLPSNRFSVTVAAYPTFFVYLPAQSPQASPLPVEFVLKDINDDEIYRANFKTSGTPGIITLSLPAQAGLLPLNVGQDYKWSFSIICQGDERSKDITVEGWIRRVKLNPVMETQLKQASPQKQVEIYAQAGIWQDALATLVQLRRDNPADSQIAAEWTKLLRAVGLDNIAQETTL
jgi:hypothetical protein